MANSQLDHYLETMEGRLKSLPPVRRQEEMREIRQHLEALVAGHRIAGLNEDELTAISGGGSPHTDTMHRIGHNCD